MDYTFSIQRLLNTPHACTRAHAAMVVAAVRSQFGFSSLHMPEEDGSDVMLTEGDLDMLALSGRQQAGVTKTARTERRKVFEEAGPIAYIPIDGTLTKKTGSLDPSSGMTGYNRIEQKVGAAAMDPAVKGILLDIDSGGGETGGLFGLTDFIYNASARRGGDKPIWAITGSAAYSAAYGIMAAADRSIAAPEAGVASVGVIALFADRSKFFQKMGVDIHVVRSGPEKAQLTGVEPPTEQALAHLQERVDDLASIFISSVAKHRKGKDGSGPSEKTIRETNGSDYIATRARAIGFIDDVMTEQQAFATMLREVNR
jgi:ClpP class serine protease